MLPHSAGAISSAFSVACPRQTHSQVSDGCWCDLRATTVAGVIGTPIRHSLSPAIVNAAFDALGVDWSYFAFEVAPEDVAAALDGIRALRFGGLSVTMPHKERVADLVDRRSPDAAALGAVNCVVRDGDALVGENTDGPGFLDALRADLDFDPRGRRVIVLGAGRCGAAPWCSRLRAPARLTWRS